MTQKFILWFLLFITLSSWVGAFSVKTTDLSYLLPHNGLVYHDSTCNNTNCWSYRFDNDYGTCTAFFDTDGIDDYIVLKCCSTSMKYVVGDTRVELGLNLEQPAMVMDTVKRLEFLVKVTFRGDPSYGGKILGCLQPQTNNGFISGNICSRYPGESPGFLDAVTIKGVDDRGYDYHKTDRDLKVKYYRAYTVSTYAVSTNWITFNWRFSPIQEDTFKLGYIAVIFVANGQDLDYTGCENEFDGEVPTIPLPHDTAIHVKEIKLYSLSYED